MWKQSDMFLAGDDIRRRNGRIKQFLRQEPGIAVLLAAANFEWTICRALLFMSETPNSQLRERIMRVRGLDGYKRIWWEEVDHRRLPDIISDWLGLTEAFRLRNRLIHGQDRATYNMAASKVEAMLQAATDIHEFCGSMGRDLNKRMPIRRKPRV